MSTPYVLTPEEKSHDNDTLRPQLWACLGTFLVLNNMAIAGRLWATRKAAGMRSRLLAEDILIILSGVLVDAVIANLMLATHYGLGLHVYTVDSRDPDWPTNLSHTFRHVWITMVLMSSFFLCVKMTLLFFYRRLFLTANPNPRLRIYWWANFVFIALWFVGATGFYLFQCQPVQYYFTRYYDRFPHEDGTETEMHGQCDSTKVLNVSLPVIFSLISDIGLLLLPIWSVSKLHMNKSKKRGLLVVFGVGSVACLLELARILALNLDTDDADDTSWGVTLFLILTAAEETTAIICACLPVVAPRVYREFVTRKRSTSERKYEKNKGLSSSSSKWSDRRFRRTPLGNGANAYQPAAGGFEPVSDDNIPLTYVEITGNDTPPADGNSHKDPTLVPPAIQIPARSYHHGTDAPSHGAYDGSAPGAIHVHTDIRTVVRDTSKRT